LNLKASCLYSISFLNPQIGKIIFCHSGKDSSWCFKKDFVK
jgi:hypothetical protein